jgi:hypothetical protein
LTPNQPGPRTEIRLGARAHNDHRPNRAHAPPPTAQVPTNQPRNALDRATVHR